MTIDEFAKRINTSRTNAYDIFSRLSIDMELLARISKVLHRNFFADMAQQMRLQLGAPSEQPTMANARLASLLRHLNDSDDVEPAFALEREALKTMLKEYFESEHRIPLLILESGYTFGTREVVKQVAREVHRGAGSAPCPKLLDVSRAKSLPAKVLIDYIDCNTFDSVEASDERLNEIARLQSDVNKKMVCIIHTAPTVSMPGSSGATTFDQWGSEISIFLSRNEQFFVAVHLWTRGSLLSWATDARMHEHVLNYIREHTVPEGIRKDHQLENAYTSFFETLMEHRPLHHGLDYPTAQAYSPSEWRFASDFIASQGEIGPELPLRHLIQDIIDFNEAQGTDRIEAPC